MVGVYSGKPVMHNPQTQFRNLVFDSKAGSEFYAGAFTYRLCSLALPDPFTRLLIYLMGAGYARLLIMQGGGTSVYPVLRSRPRSNF